VPTYMEESIPLFRATWFGIVVPAGVAKETVARLHSDISAVLGDAKWRERYMPADSYETSGIGLGEFAKLLADSRANGKAIAELLRADGYRPQ